MGKPKLSSRSDIHAAAAPKIERKVIEKNRRNRLKILYSELFSLLPNNHTFREALALPDQIDEAVKYIEIMKSKLQDMRQKKESLSRANFRTPESCLTTDHQPTSTPLVEVQRMGSNVDVILANGLADYSIFLAIIHNLLRQDGVEVANANFSEHGSSTINVLRNKVEESNSTYIGATTSGGLKELIVCGSSSSEVVESQLTIWDYTEPNFWNLDIDEVFPLAGFN